MNKGLFYIIFFLLSVMPSAAHFDNDRIELKKISIQEKRIQKYHNDETFNYEPVKRKQTFLDRIFQKIKNGFEYILRKLFSWLFGQKAGGKILRYFLKSLPYIAIFVFVYLIFRFLLGVDLIRLKSSRHRQITQVQLMEDEEIIKGKNLDELIREAKSKQDYRLAVRYQYLKTLKMLIDKGLIEWHPEKTNRDYVREINEKMLRVKFTDLTFIYDYVWYGNFFPDKKEYEEIEINFVDFAVL